MSKQTTNNFYNGPTIDYKIDDDEFISIGKFLMSKGLKIDDLENDLLITAYSFAMYDNARRTTDFISFTELYLFLKRYTNDITESTSKFCLELCRAVMLAVEKELKEKYMTIFE